MNFAIDQFDKERFGLITGSQCSVLFPLKGDGKKGQKTYAKKLANQMYFQCYDEVTTWQTEHGKMAEHFAFQHYHTYIDGRISEGRWVRKGDCGGTIDSEVPNVRGVDFKCPTTLQKWLDYLHEPLDKDQIDQCQMYMYLTGLEEWQIAAFLTETQFMTDNGLTYPIQEKDRMIIVSVEKDPLWEERLQEPKDYVISERNKYLNELERFFKYNMVQA